MWTDVCAIQYTLKFSRPLAISRDLQLMCFSSVWVSVGPVGFQFIIPAENSRIHLQIITWPEVLHWSWDLPKIGSVLYISRWKDNVQGHLGADYTSMCTKWSRVRVWMFPNHRSRPVVSSGTSVMGCFFNAQESGTRWSLELWRHVVGQVMTASEWGEQLTP